MKSSVSLNVSGSGREVGRDQRGVFTKGIILKTYNKGKITDGESPGPDCTSYFNVRLNLFFTNFDLGCRSRR